MYTYALEALLHISSSPASNPEMSCRAEAAGRASIVHSWKAAAQPAVATRLVKRSQSIGWCQGGQIIPVYVPRLKENLLNTKEADAARHRKHRFLFFLDS